MSFYYSKATIATEKHLKAHWLGGKPGEFFRCALCGYKFKIGDLFRIQYTNDTPDAWGNPLVCVVCDGTKEEIVAKWRQMHKDAKEKYWWFTR